jgi:rfaE bifunctional protein kinase chain/domain
MEKKSGDMHLAEIIGNFPDRRILILGDLLVDEYIWGSAERISPEAPVPVVNVDHREIRPGGAANVAMTIAALGGNPILAGVVGDDLSGDQFKGMMKSRGFSDDGIITEPSRITPLKTRVIASNQQMLRIDHEFVNPVSENVIARLVDYLNSAFKNCDALLISDYAKGLIGTGLLAPVLDSAKDRNILISVDPKPVNMNLYKGVSLVSPNLKETIQASGIKIIDRESLRKAAHILMNKISPKAILITKGADGLSLFTSDGGEDHLPAMTSQVYDVSGAGDTLIGTLTLAQAAGADLKDAIQIANCAASIVVRKPGVATLDRTELLASLENRQEWESKTIKT